MRLIETHWDSLRLIETHWDSLRLIETHWHSLRLIETLWDTLRLTVAHYNCHFQHQDAMLWFILYQCPASEELQADHFVFLNFCKSPFQGFTISGLLRDKNTMQLQRSEQHMLQSNYCHIYGLQQCNLLTFCGSFWCLTLQKFSISHDKIVDYFTL